MTPEQLLGEVRLRLRKRHPTATQRLPFYRLAFDVGQICIELGVLPDDVLLELVDAHRIRYRVPDTALERIAAIPLPMTIAPGEVSAAMLAALAGGGLPPLSRAEWSYSEPDVAFGDWRVTLFIEAGAVYEVYAAQAPDGRSQEFRLYHENPWSLLSPEQQVAIENALGAPSP